MQFKRCFKCLLELPLGAFYKHSQMGDGHLNKCKECTKKDAAKHRMENIDEIRAYDKRRASMPHRVSARNRIVREWSRKFPNRKKAQTAVHNAIRDGKLERMPCFVCGAKAEAHHPDYDQPLDVVWLCPPHHKQAHALMKKAA